MGCYALTKPLHAYMTYCHVRLGYYTSNMPLISEAYERRSQRLTNHLIAVTTRVPDLTRRPVRRPPRRAGRAGAEGVAPAPVGIFRSGKVCLSAKIGRPAEEVTLAPGGISAWESCV